MRETETTRDARTCSPPPRVWRECTARRGVTARRTRGSTAALCGGSVDDVYVLLLQTIKDIARIVLSHSSRSSRFPVPSPLYTVAVASFVPDRSNRRFG